ncbi:50S ribosomal protein L9 [Telmatocola sphagniphila]|uniref:Large ribosomal subunit protein bL9 n=1 Tax=Telmatocola sphagniphila TaxID=1123043 RepID=A0A8E6B5V4_9BACT|nr:50S ribosomal protein L9 [Telmatocola sphagniphila]QVL32503.1 50S ribosomal protein L9 [Telmatocola sphagniphila]
MAKDKGPKTLPQPKKKIRVRNQVRKGTHGGVQLVLVEDVAFLGKQGALVEVKPGYARNYLLPNSMAVIPSEHNLRRLERYKIRVQQAREAKVADLKSLAEQINRQARITIDAISNEEGHLFGSVGPVEISKALKGKNLMVEPDMVKMETHIKECGIYPEVKLSLGFEIETKIEVAVIPQTSSTKR